MITTKLEKSNNYYSKRWLLDTTWSHTVYSMVNLLWDDISSIRLVLDVGCLTENEDYKKVF